MSIHNYQLFWSFDVLPQNNEEVLIATPQTTRSNKVIPGELIKPPPLNCVKSVLEFKDLSSEISKLIGEDNFFC